MNLCLWTVNITHASQSSRLPLGGTGWLEWAEVRYSLSPTLKARLGWSYLSPFCQVSYTLNYPSQVVSGKNNFSIGQALLRRTQCSGIFQNGYFPLPPTEKKKKFIWYSLWELIWSSGGKNTKVWVLPYDCVPLEFLTLRVVHTDPTAIYQLQFRFSDPGIGSLGNFCLWISVQLFVILSTCLSLEFGVQKCSL